jgi:fatty acid desaturase
VRRNEDRRALGLVAAHFALVALGFAVDLPLPVAGGLVCLLVFSAFVGLNAAHYAMHAPVFKARPLNRLWQCVLSCTFGAPASSFVPAHNLSHHRFLQTPKDVLRTTEVRHARNLVNLLVYTRGVTRHMVATDMRFFATMRTRNPAWFRQLLCEVTAVLAWFTTMAMVDWRRFLVFIALPGVVALRLMFAYGYLQHDGTDAGHSHNHSRNFTGAVFNWLTLNCGYHAMHHHTPHLHWSDLAREHHGAYVQNMHAGLDEPSLLGYVWRAFIWRGGVRERFDGAPLTFAPPTPADPWLPESARRSKARGDLPVLAANRAL